MHKSDQDSESVAQKKVARKYKLLGYDVMEHPSSDRLPDFMHGVTPDIVAQSETDSVVIEIKKSGSLKGSNELVNIADGISNHPDWRFELIVLKDDEGDRSQRSRTDFEQILEKARVASSLFLLDVAYVYLGAVLVRTAQDIARTSGIKVGNKTDRDLIHDLGFRGVLPQHIIDASLTVLSVSDKITHGSVEEPDVTEDDVRGLIDLCEAMRTFCALAAE